MDKLSDFWTRLGLFLLILVVCMIVRVVALNQAFESRVAEIALIPGNDLENFDRCAREYASGKIYTRPGYDDNTEWAQSKTAPFRQSPLYPAMLSLVYRLTHSQEKIENQDFNFRILVAFQMTIGLLATCGMYHLGVMLGGPALGLWAMLFYGLNAWIIVYEMASIRACFLSHAIVFTFLAWFKARQSHPAWWLAFAVMAALNVMLKPVFQPFLLILALALLGESLWWRKKKDPRQSRKTLKDLCWATVSVLVVLSLAYIPIVKHNLKVREHRIANDRPYDPSFSALLQTTTRGPWSLINGNANFPEVTGVGWNFEGIRGDKGKQIIWDSSVNGRNSLMKTAQLTLQTHDSLWETWLPMLWNKLRATITQYEIPNNIHCLMFAEKVPIIGWLPFHNGFVILFGLAGFLFSWRLLQSDLWRVMTLHAVAMLAVMVIFYVIGRFRMPAIPFFTLGSALFVHRLWTLILGWKTEGSKRKVVLAWLACLAFSAFVTHPWPGPISQQDKDMGKKGLVVGWRPSEYHNYTVIWQRYFHSQDKELRNKAIAEMIWSYDEGLARFPLDLNLIKRNIELRRNIAALAVQEQRLEDGHEAVFGDNGLLRSMLSWPQVYFEFYLYRDLLWWCWQRQEKIWAQEVLPLVFKYHRKQAENDPLIQEVVAWAKS